MSYRSSDSEQWTWSNSPTIVMAFFDRTQSPHLSSPGSQPEMTEPVFVEMMLDSEEDMESSLSRSLNSDIGTQYFVDDRETCQGLSSAKPLNDEENGGPSNWDLDLPSVEMKELETVFEDDVLSDSSSCRERSGSACSIPPVIRDRSGSTWSTMSLYDRERSSSSTSGYRERSYSSTSAYHEASISGASSHRHRSYSVASGHRQRSASIGSVLPNPLQQSHRLSIQYMKSAFTFLDPKGKLSMAEISPTYICYLTHCCSRACLASIGSIVALLDIAHNLYALCCIVLLPLLLS